MKTELYYFTGTGNSLAAARDLARHLEAPLFPVATAVKEGRIRTDADAVGIVFPSYLAHLYGVPLIVERFFRSLEGIGGKYLFAVCTCGAYELVNALPTLKNLARFVRGLGGKLSGEFSLRLPMNNLDYAHIPVPISTDRDRMFKIAGRKLVRIAHRVASRRPGGMRALTSLVNLAFTPMYRALAPVCVKALEKTSKVPEGSSRPFRELMPLTDSSITVNDACTGCGTCVRVCPVENIVLADGKPEWRHRCEMCFACDEWCPKGAIQHWGRAEGVKYRHPGVKLADMCLRG